MNYSKLFKLIICFCVVLSGFLIPLEQTRATDNEMFITDAEKLKLINKGLTNEQIDYVLSRIKYTGETDLESLTNKLPLTIQNNSSIVKSKVINDMPISELSKLIVPSTTSGSDGKKLTHIKLEKNMAPFSVFSDFETISTIDGSLTVPQIDMSLVGRNGLSFDLKRTYNSNDAQKYDMSTESTYYNDDKYYAIIAADEYLEEQAYETRTGSMSQTHTGYCIEKPVIIDSSVPVPVGEYSKVFYTSNAANIYKDQWKTSHFVLESKDWGYCTTVGTNKYRYKYDLLSDGSSYVVEDSDKNRHTKTGDYIIYELGPFNSEADAETAIKNDIDKILKYSSWTGDYLRGITRNYYKVPASPETIIFRETEEHYYYNNKTITSKLEKKYPIGKGWSWNVPYIQSEDGKLVLHFSDIGSYEIENNQLKGYPWKDLSFSLDSTEEVDSIKSKYLLKTIEGKKYYFDTDGNLIKIKDTYDNYIIFKYIKNSLNNSVLSEISNNTNHKITIQYTENEIKIIQGEKTVRYLLSKNDGVDILNQVIDPMGRITTYDYQWKNAMFNLIGKTPNTHNPYALLVGITHPTGLKTSYHYEGVPHKNMLGEDAVNESYRVINRNDEITYNNDLKSAQNLKEFIYDTNNDYSYTSSYNYTTKIIEGDNSTSHLINRNYDSAKKNVNYYKVKETIEGLGDTKNIVEHTYDVIKSNPNPIKTTETFESKTVSRKSTPIVTETQYNDYGRITSEKSELGLQSVYEYDSTTQLLAGKKVPSTDTLAKYTSYERNTKGSITKETVRENNNQGKLLFERTFEDFDLYGNYQKEVTKFGDKTYIQSYEYSPKYDHTYLTKVTSIVTNLNGEKKPLTVQATYYPDSGNLASIIDGMGYETRYNYDKLDRLTAIINPDNSTTTMTYYDKENRIETKNEVGVISFEEWNPIGWLIKEGIKDGSEYNAIKLYHYNKYGDLAISSNALGQETKYEYDYLKRVIKETNPLGSAKRVQYNDINRIQTLFDEVGNKVEQKLDEVGRVSQKTEYFSTYSSTESFTYNNADQVLTSKDAKGNLSSYKYDVLGNLISVTFPNGEITRYEYDFLGNATKTTSPDGRSSTKHFDEGGRLLSKIDANKRVSTYQYNDNDQLVYALDRNGNEHHYEYTNRNWLQKASNLSGTVEYEYFSNGARKTMKDSTGLTSYEYTPEGYLLRKVYPDGKTISYQYDQLGNKKEIISPYNQRIVYQYNKMNQIKSLGIEEDEQLVQYTYLANGELESKRQKNGTISSYTFDHSNLTEILFTNTHSSSRNLNLYNYDLNKNIEEILKINYSNPKDQEINNLTYDTLDRVMSTTAGNEMYTYDKKGNRSFQDSDILPAIKEKKYEYDANNRLIKVTTDDHQITYRYNGDGLLYEKDDDHGTTRYYYDGDVLLAEALALDWQPVLKNHYITGIYKEIQLNADGKLYYYVTDGLSDIVELRDERGNIANEYKYDIWGNTIVTKEKIANPFRYSGELWEEETGLQYLRSRWYDPMVGRFLNEDSFEGELNNPLSLNQYTYVEQNPLIYVDPEGTKKSSKPERGGMENGSGPMAKTGGPMGGGGGSSKFFENIKKFFNKGIDNAIPKFSKATIDPRKLTDYALNPNHPVGGNKAKVFESALGYNQSNASQLMKQIQKNLPNTPATLGKADQYGQRYTVDMLIKGANGKTAIVRTGWIIKSGSNTPEMTTLFVK